MFYAICLTISSTEKNKAVEKTVDSSIRMPGLIFMSTNHKHSVEM